MDASLVAVTHLREFDDNNVVREADGARAGLMSGRWLTLHLGAEAFGRAHLHLPVLRAEGCRAHLWDLCGGIEK